MCCIGFGGRLVIAGGRMGTRVGLTTLESTFSKSEKTKKWIQHITSSIGPLGAVSPFVTESVTALCASRATLTATPDRFSADSLRDANLLWTYMQYQLEPKPTGFGAPSARSRFISYLWRQALPAADPSSPVLAYVDCVVRGDMRGSIEVARSNPALHPVSMAIASIHSAEFFREAILAYTASMTKEPKGGPLEQETLLDVLKVCINAFASTGPATTALPNLEHWKLYACLIAVLVKPGETSSGGSSFLVRLADGLAKDANNPCAAHLCILLSNKRAALDSVDAGDAMLCLLGADHRDVSHFYRLLDSGPLQLSEVFEYTVRVNSGIPFFMALQPWKFAYASLLACDLGLFDLASRYLEIINAFVRAVPTGKYASFFRTGIRELEVRIAESKSHTASTGPQVGIADLGQATLGAIWGGIKAVTGSI